VERIEGTIFGIGERAGNTDLITLMMTLMQHPEYSSQIAHLVKNSKKLAHLIETVQSATGYTGRPVQPGYGFDAIVNRSGVHQAKVAKMKSSYVWIDPEMFGLRGRDLIDIGPLAGKMGVEVLLKQLKVEYREQDILTITSFLRSIFSPDTNIHDIAQTFPQLDETDITRLSDKVVEIRRESRVLMSTVARQKEWRKKTQDIVRKAIRYFYGQK
jgi:isopropylmalate/homocitrate/citramalate synthase